jgi:hypothetical protein
MGVFRHSYEGHGSYFLGKWSSGGNGFYFLVAFLIKNPIPMIIFLIAGFFILVKRGIKTGDRLVLIIAALFFIVSSLGRLQIGIRHLLPLYPFCFMIAGKCEELLKKKILNIIVVSLMAWCAVSSLLAWPHYIGYFNEAIGGPGHGYKYLRDSNIDWGQDLPALADYMKKNNIDEVVLDYFGQADPAAYGVRYREFSPGEFNRPENMVYAVSAQYLENISWSKDRDPTALAGYSVFIYDFSKKDQ